MRANRKQKRNSLAFSLIELTVASGISVFVLGVLGLVTIFTARSFVAMGNYADLDRQSRNALDIMSREIRKSSALTAYATNKLTFQNSDGSTFIYEYSPTTGTLMRKQGSTNTVLLRQCDFLRFGISQRNPSNNFSFYPATDYSKAKLVDLSWKCSRAILGKKINTESVQTAKIVIRN
jgi:hypothetical protein